MGVTIRPSSTALAAAGRAIAARRNQFIDEWSQWIHRRQSPAEGFSRQTVVRQLTLLIDILTEMAGPRRRSATELWLSTSEWYGQTAAQRGLATGEVVEEFQHLRELLIRDLSEEISGLPARQSLATVLRLNRFLDEGIAHAVVGYTDALVETLLNSRGVPIGGTESAGTVLIERLELIEAELDRVRTTEAGPTDI